MITQLSSCPSAWRHGFSRGSWAVYYVPACGYPPQWEGCVHCLEPSQSHSWATPQAWAMALPFCQQQVAAMACSTRSLRWWAYTSSEHGIQSAGQGDALKMLEMGRSGSAGDLKERLVMRQLFAARTFYLCHSLFSAFICFFLISFLDHSFGGQIPAHLWHMSSCGDSVLLTAKLILRLRGFLQQYLLSSMLWTCV